MTNSSYSNNMFPIQITKLHYNTILPAIDTIINYSLSEDLSIDRLNILDSIKH